MRNLLIGTTLVIMAVQETHALTDGEILKTIEQGIGKMDVLCKKLGALDAKDKKRVEEMVYDMNPQTEAEKKIAMLGRKHPALEKCISAWPQGDLAGAL